LGGLPLSADGSSDLDASFKLTPSHAPSMDDALRRRLDRLTWLVAGLLVAVLALGFHDGGSQYLATVLAFVVVAVLAAVVGVVLSSIGDLAAGEET